MGKMWPAYETEFETPGIKGDEVKGVNFLRIREAISDVIDEVPFDIYLD